MKQTVNHFEHLLSESFYMEKKNKEAYFYHTSHFAINHSSASI